MIKDLTSDKILQISERNYWEVVRKAITRALYDAIDAHEKHGEDFIPVAWLRDYADDIAEHYPRVTPDEV